MLFVREIQRMHDRVRDVDYARYIAHITGLRYMMIGHGPLYELSVCRRGGSTAMQGETKLRN